MSHLYKVSLNTFCILDDLSKLADLVTGLLDRIMNDKILLASSIETRVGKVGNLQITVSWTTEEESWSPSVCSVSRDGSDCEMFSPRG